VAVGTASNKLFRRLCDAIGRPELASDERYRSHRGRAQHREAVNGQVAAWMRTRSCDEALRALGPEGADVPCARVASPEALIDDPQLLARGMIERHPHPVLGEILFHGNPLQLSGAEPRERALAPDLGADNDAVYAALGLRKEDLAQLAEEGVI
jgi:formyl-CoA transferase